MIAWFWPFAREEPHGHPPFYALVGLVGDLLAPCGPPAARPARADAGVQPDGRRPLAFVAPPLGRLGRRWPRPGPGCSSRTSSATATTRTTTPCSRASGSASILAFAEAVEPATTGTAASALGLGDRLRRARRLRPPPPSSPAGSCRCRSSPGRASSTATAGRMADAGGRRASSRRGSRSTPCIPPWWTEPLGGRRAVPPVEPDARPDDPDPGPVPGPGLHDAQSESLPWYNTLVWTVLGDAGRVPGAGRRRGCAVGRRGGGREPFGLLVVGHWAFLLILRALPHTPGHDGVRQFLPAFGVLALVRGLGCGVGRRAVGRAGARRSSPRPGRGGRRASR